MRAISIKEFGGIEKVKLAQLPKSAPGPGEALVRIKAGALNHLDLWVLKGRPGASIKEAHVLGSDCAGVVEALGPGCENLAVAVGGEVVVNPGVSCKNANTACAGCTVSVQTSAFLVSRLKACMRNMPLCRRLIFFPSRRI